MAKIKQLKKESTKAVDAANDKAFIFPLDSTNFIILGLGVALIILGYIFMAMPDHPDDFLTLTLAPIMLVLSFLVVIPFGLMYRKKTDIE